MVPGMIIPLEGGAPVIFQWNPSHIEGPNRSAKWDEISTAGALNPYTQYAHGETSHITFELDFSRYDNDDGYVESQVEALRSMTYPTVPGMGISRPPRVQLILGGWLNETCVVKFVSPVYTTLFDPNSLLPRFAKVKIVLSIYK